MDLRSVLGPNLRAQRQGCDPVTTATFPFLRTEPLRANGSRHWRQRTYPGKVFTAARVGADADWKVQRLPGRPHHVPLSPEPRQGRWRRAARKDETLHFCRRDHASDIEPVV